MNDQRESSDRITAPPGTPEYDDQFERQSLSAIDAALQMWVVRLFFGVMAVGFVAVVIVASLESRFLPGYAGLLFLAFDFTLIAVGCKSICIRYLFAPVNRRHHTRKTDPQNDTK